MTNPDSGSATEELEVEYDAEPLDIGFNSRYLLDIAAQIEGEVAVLKLADPGSPTLIQDKDAKRRALRPDADAGVGTFGALFRYRLPLRERVRGRWRGRVEVGAPTSSSSGSIVGNRRRKSRHGMTPRIPRFSTCLCRRSTKSHSWRARFFFAMFVVHLSVLQPRGVPSRSISVSP